ncbi:proteasome subunit beta type-3 [Orycteropus afer afer]|uniref:Proteasome subunit beta type-3 n=1 Tax=Orycteropus afer afer TaxID=1230840 RepID=A0AC54Z6L9_ORYAF|nr:proteasome subunit beta type-3 [Orycteropus afer afer]
MERSQGPGDQMKTEWDTIIQTKHRFSHFPLAHRRRLAVCSTRGAGLCASLAAAAGGAGGVSRRLVPADSDRSSRLHPALGLRSPVTPAREESDQGSLEKSGGEVEASAGEANRYYVTATPRGPELNAFILWSVTRRPAHTGRQVTPASAHTGSIGVGRKRMGERDIRPERVLQELSIMSYNGGAVMAMKGKNCVAIAADRRFGIQAQMVTTDFQKIFPMGDRLYIGLAGLATDVQTVAQRLKFRLNLYELKEGRQIRPYTLMSMVANLLYEKRFGPYYTEPVIAGLDPKTFKPFICSLDLIGCPMVTDDFVVSGTCAEQMYGMCESLWEPNMDPEHLFETISQAMLNAVDRDAVSGMGVIVHIIEKDKITTRTLKARMD